MESSAEPQQEGALAALRRRRLSVCRARLEDAGPWLTFLQALDKDTEFMMFEPGERSQSVEKCEAAIRRVDAVPGAMLLLVWNAGDEVVGYVKGDVLPLERKAHVMSVSCALLTAYRGDTGKAVIQYFLDEVEREGIIKRVEGAVIASNVRMLFLALSLGLTIEGMKRKAVRLKTEMVDEYLIAKYFD